VKEFGSFFFLILTLISTGCSGNNADDRNNESIYRFEGEHFSYILYDGAPQSILSSVQSTLEENFSRIINDLEVASMNRVTIRIWKDETDFLDTMFHDLGVRYYGASGYVYSSNDIRILYRNNTPQIALHEFCHAASLVVNNRFGNRPRWFWEAVAIYEAGEYKDPKTISYLAAGNFPAIEELNSNFNEGNYKIYDVGYLLSEYIVHDFGKETFVNLIRSNANIEETLGISTPQLESGWKSFVMNKYFYKL